LNRISVCLVALAGGLVACTYQVESTTTQTAAPFSAYTDKVSGKWALLVDADKAG